MHLCADFQAGSSKEYLIFFLFYINHPTVNECNTANDNKRVDVDNKKEYIMKVRVKTANFNWFHAVEWFLACVTGTLHIFAVKHRLGAIVDQTDVSPRIYEQYQLRRWTNSKHCMHVLRTCSLCTLLQWDRRELHEAVTMGYVGVTFMRPLLWGRRDIHEAVTLG